MFFCSEDFKATSKAKNKTKQQNNKTTKQLQEPNYFFLSPKQVILQTVTCELKCLNKS